MLEFQCKKHWHKNALPAKVMHGTSSDCAGIFAVLNVPTSQHLCASTCINPTLCRLASLEQIEQLLKSSFSTALPTEDPKILEQECMAHEDEENIAIVDYKLQCYMSEGVHEGWEFTQADLLAYWQICLQLLILFCSSLWHSPTALNSHCCIVLLLTFYPCKLCLFHIRKTYFCSNR